jgi:hypothetical protein
LLSRRGGLPLTCDARLPGKGAATGGQRDNQGRYDAHRPLCAWSRRSAEIRLGELFTRAHEIADIALPIPRLRPASGRILHLIAARITGLDDLDVMDDWGYVDNAKPRALIKRHCAAAESLNRLCKSELIDFKKEWQGVDDCDDRHDGLGILVQ